MANTGQASFRKAPFSTIVIRFELEANFYFCESDQQNKQNQFLGQFIATLKKN